MTRNDANLIIEGFLKDGLKEEFDDRFCRYEDEPEIFEDEPDTLEIYYWICDDEELLERAIVTKLREIGIILGIYQEVTDLDDWIVCSGGRSHRATPDFRLKKKMYMFKDWNGSIEEVN